MICRIPVLVAMFGVVALPVSAGIFESSPDAIVCNFKGVAGRPAASMVFHVDMRYEDGSVLYRPLGVGALQLTLKSDGKVDAQNIDDCDGKTAQELRDAGRAFDYR